MSAAPPLPRPDITGQVTRGVARLMAALGMAPLLELTLPNGRRVDVVALGPKGEIAIVEVKSGIEDFRADQKWAEYQPYCDRFYFAVAPEFPRSVLPGAAGLIIADAFGGAVVAEPPTIPLAPARRRTVILAFARAAAFRTVS